MLKTRLKRLADTTELELQRLAAIGAAVAALGDEDLLDSDIFVAGGPMPLRAMAEEQMRRRGLSL